MDLEVINIDTSMATVPSSDGTLLENRGALVEATGAYVQSKATIAVWAYNRLEKTKRCVESILRNTDDVDYELILVDNGSTDETLEYFKSIDFKKKKIIHITKNVGAGFPAQILDVASFGEFYCGLANDIIVTPHWLSNIIKCFESDLRIGAVNPVSNNVSNLQNVDLKYNSYEELQNSAEQYNNSNPKLWEERIRLITLGTVYRKSLLLSGLWPLSDGGFFHDFGDDDISFRIRRAGYKLILARDTWICHDHDFRASEDKNPEKFRMSLCKGRENFKEKYFGIDAWEDANNFWQKYLIGCALTCDKRANILGIDVKCGQPILDIKNWLVLNGVDNVECHSFTQDAKYWLDLSTICGAKVGCASEAKIMDFYENCSMDYIVIDKPVNDYERPMKVLKDVFKILKPGGVVLIKVRNTYSALDYLYCCGEYDLYNRSMARNIPIEEVLNVINDYGTILNGNIIPKYLDIQDCEPTIQKILPSIFSQEKKDEIRNRLMVDEYIMRVVKNEPTRNKNRNQ